MTKSTSRKPSKLRSARTKSAHSKTRRPTIRKPETRKLARARAAAATSLASNGKSGPHTKRALVVAMLRASSGATIDTIMRATGWQQHSVRGFLAAVVRKKLGLDLLSKAADGGRVYRINDRTALSFTDSQADKAA